MNVKNRIALLAGVLLGPVLLTVRPLPLLAQAEKSSDSPAAAAAAPAFSAKIIGSVKSGDTPIPGVVVTAFQTTTRKRFATSTDPDGAFSILLTEPGRYIVRAEMLAFARSIVEIEFAPDKPGAEQRADFSLTLLSRAQQPDLRNGPAGLSPEAIQQRLQTLGLGGGMPDVPGFDAGSQGDASSANPATSGFPSMSLGGADAATESFSVTGAEGRTNDTGLDPERLRERIQEMRDRGELPGGGGQGRPGGGFGGGPGGGPGAFRLNRRFDINRPHGMLFYESGDSIFDARAFSLTGVPADQPSYAKNRYGAILGGPLKIPHLFDAGKSTFFYIGYFGSLSTNPFDVFGIVPTQAERSGDFSQTFITSGPNAGQPVVIINPATGLPFPQNKILPGSINAAAAGLLRFIPQPNQPGAVENFHRVTSTADRSQNLNLRINHSLDGSGTQGRGQGQGRGGGPFGALRARNSINFNFNFRTTSSDTPNFAPLLGGHTSSLGANAGLAYVRSFGAWQNRASVNINISRIETHNFYAGIEDVEGELGIFGVSTNPFDFGPPSLSFTNFSGLGDVTPRLRRDFTWQLADAVSWNKKKHNVRFGGDFRRIAQNLHANSNPRGSFVFTGLATAQTTPGGVAPGTGYDFADFLLGLPQQTSIQFSPFTYDFRGNSWDLFVQDDWRVLPKLSIFFGLRYEYVSPFSENNNRLVNLDVNGNFTAAAPVQPGGTGPSTGVFPSGLVNPDRNNFAPRIGIAWKPFSKTVVRSGYGMTYNTGAYSSIAQQLAFQPPFSFTQTNVNSPALPLSLQAGFPQQGSTVTNNFGVDRNYRLGYVQTWNLNIQDELKGGMVLNVGYTGTKGTRLDIVRAPNRGPNGLLIPNVQAFLWQSSGASSILHSGTVSLSKRLRRGVSFGTSYTYAKSIDNASTIGGGATVVAQNDQDLAAERGLSSFDQRHRFTATYIYELPFGQSRHWLSSGAGAAAKILSNWTWNGSFTAASGIPFTARVLGSFSDVRNGVNGTLRADVTGQPVGLANPSIAEFFNTAAFKAPSAGTFGDAGRNTISGPGTLSFNMGLGKSIAFKDAQQLELRLQATNVFNHPNFSAIDTIVNSPSFGRVTGVAQMRQLQFLARYRF
jgi:trimeric autotransporter adhesin